MIDVRLIFVLMSLALSSGVCAQDFAILYHETPSEFQYESLISDSNSASDSDSSKSPVSLTAFGRQYDLLLTSNSRLTKNLSAEQKRLVDGISLFRGEVRNLSGSWVRLSVVEGVATGVIWDGNDLLVIERRQDIGQALIPTNNDPESELVIYRLRDTIGPISDQFVNLLSENDEIEVATILDEPIIAEAVLSPIQQLDIALVGDSRLQPAEATAAFLLGRINVADGIFLEEVGVYLNVAEILIFDSTTDPLSGSVGSDLLEQFATLKSTTESLRTMGLAHLFTGADLISDDGDDSLAGVAYLGALCDEALSVSITEVATGLPVGLIAAHEIGHNFGAPHDNELGSACETTPDGFLMSPEITGNSFSDCSIEQMTPEILAATCLADVVPGDTALRSVDGLSEVLRAEEFTFTIAVDNLGTSNVVSPVLTVVASDFEILDIQPNQDDLDVTFWNCDRSGTPIRCSANTLRSGVSGEFEVTALAQDVGGAIDFSISAENDPIQSNNELQRVFEIAPAFDIDTSFRFPSPDHQLLKPNDEAAINVVIENDGIDPIDNVEAEITLPSFVEVLSVTPGSGSCNAVSGNELQQACAIGTLGSNEEIIVELQVRALQLVHQDVVWRLEDLTVNAAAPRIEEDVRNNSDEVSIIVSDRYVDLRIGLEPPVEIQSGSTADFSIFLRNEGPDEATNLLVNLAYDDEFDVFNILPPSGDFVCVHDAALRHIACEVGDMQPGEEVASSWNVQIVLNSDTPTHFDVDFEVRAPEYNSNGNPAAFNTSVLVIPDPTNPTPTPDPDPTPNPAPAPSGSGGGGGGAINPISVLILLILQRSAIASRNRRARRRRFQRGDRVLSDNI